MEVRKNELHIRNSTQVFCCVCVSIYRVSQEECARLWEGVPYVKVYRYTPKQLCPKLNGYGDNGQRKVRSYVSSTHYTLKAVEVICLTLTSACGRSLLSPSLPVFLSRIVLVTQTTTTTQNASFFFSSI
jgi:hypothetical protein